MSRILCLTAICALALGCQKPTPSSSRNSHPQLPRPHVKTKAPAKRSGYLEILDGTGVVQLRADGFKQLPLQQKLLAYYLIRAAEAGQEIIFDHTHPHGLLIKRTLEAIWIHSKGISPVALAKIKHYTKLYWLHGGPYHTRNKSKLPVAFSREELAAAVKVARQNGAVIPADVVKTVGPLLFDPKVQPLLKNMKPSPGQDIITASGMNYYENVTMADVKGFKEQFQLNSRLVKRDGKLIEEVFRAGRPPLVPAGRHHKPLAAVVRNLKLALPYASEKQKLTLTELITHFETGSLEAFDRMNIAWLKDNPRVDLILGYIEQYIDPRGVKGAFEGIISFVEPKQSRLMNAVAKNAQYFEDRSPWLPIYKRAKISIPVANAIHVLVGIGDAGPFLPAGINLPNSNVIRQKHGSKSVLLTNVNQAVDRATLGTGTNEFAPPQFRAQFKSLSGKCWEALVAYHEVVGHGSGKTSPKVGGKPAKFIKEFYSALEEARADLVALHHMFDPKTVALQLLPDSTAAPICYRIYVLSDLLMLRRLAGATRIQDDHMRAHHLVVNYVWRKHQAVKRVSKGGKSYLVVADMQKMRKGVAELLAEVMRIKAEGDYAAAKQLFETYGATFDLKLRDEVVRRAKRAGLANFHAFVNPQFKLVKQGGKIVDVAIEYKETFSQQMLRYARVLHAQ